MSQKFKCVQVHWRDDAHVDRTTYVTLTSVEDRVAELQPKVFDEAVGWAFELVTGFSPNRIIDYSPTELYDQHGRVWQDEVEEAPPTEVSDFAQCLFAIKDLQRRTERLEHTLMLQRPKWNHQRAWIQEHRRDTYHYCGPDGLNPVCGAPAIPGAPLVSSNPDYAHSCLQCVQLVGHPSQEPKDA